MSWKIKWWKYPAVPALLALLRDVSEWREPAKKGKRVYDDKAFFESLNDQYVRRRSLTPRQVSALRRIVQAYAAQIPDFDARTKGLGLERRSRKGETAEEE